MCFKNWQEDWYFVSFSLPNWFMNCWTKSRAPAFTRSNVILQPFILCNGAEVFQVNLGILILKHQHKRINRTPRRVVRVAPLSSDLESSLIFWGNNTLRIQGFATPISVIIPNLDIHLLRKRTILHCNEIILTLANVQDKDYALVKQEFI